MKFLHALEKLEEVGDQLVILNQTAIVLNDRIHSLEIGDVEKSELVALCQDIVETIEVIRHG